MITPILLVLAFSGAVATPQAPVIQRPGSGPAVQRPGQAKPEAEPPVAVAQEVATLAASPTRAEPAPAATEAVVAEPEPEPVPEEAEPVVDPVEQAVEEVPAIASADLSAPVLQRPTHQKPAWTPFDDSDVVAPPPPSWTPFDDADGPRIVPPSLLARFEPAALERPVIRSAQMWEAEDAPIVANPDLGRHSRKHRQRRRWR